MESELSVLAQSEWQEASSLFEGVTRDKVLLKSLVRWSEVCADKLAVGGTVFFAGNGGSFADAQHMAAELSGKLNRVRPPLAGLALGTNASSISAIGNDFGFEEVFARELEALHDTNSVVVGMSTSGNSRNLLNLATRAQVLNVPMVCFTGANGGEISKICDTIRVPSNRTERIQEVHTLLGHTLCLLIETKIFPFDS